MQLRTLWEATAMHMACRGAVRVRTCRTSIFDSPALIESKEAGVTSAVSKVSCSLVLMTMSNSAPLACVLLGR